MFAGFFYVFQFHCVSLRATTYRKKYGTEYGKSISVVYRADSVPYNNALIRGGYVVVTDKEIENASILPGKKVRKMGVGQGLYLFINKSGKSWRYDYRLDGKRKTYTFGRYPDLPLGGKKIKGRGYVKGARDLLIEAKQLVAQGIDPVILRQQEKQKTIDAQRVSDELIAVDHNTFKVVALKWFEIKKVGLAESYSCKIMGRLDRYVFPHIGSIPVVKLNKKQVADVISNIVDCGLEDSARRVGQYIKQILEYSCDRGDIEFIPMGNIKTLIPAHEVQPMPALADIKRIGELLRAIDVYSGTFIVCSALKVLPMLAVRGGEFRLAEWTEFNLDDAMWTIPASHRKLKMKAKKDPANSHLVPLSIQAVRLLKDLYNLTGRGRHVFPSVRGDARPMSENTINIALHNMGFKGELVGHGFRAMFSTTLNEQGFNRDAVERQLAHKEKDATRGAYNRAEYIDERIKMMQHWADYLDNIKNKP